MGRPKLACLVALLALSVFINYIDRGNFSIAAPLLKGDLRISASQLSILLSAFFWSYTALLFVSGWLVDRFDVNLVLAAGYVLWSLATAATGIVHGFAMLLVIAVDAGHRRICGMAVMLKDPGAARTGTVSRVGQRAIGAGVECGPMRLSADSFSCTFPIRLPYCAPSPGWFRSGGVVAFQEPYFALALALTAHLPLWSAVLSVGYEALRRARANTEMGLALYRIFQEAGLPAPTMNLEVSLGSDREFIRWLYDGFCSLRPQIERINVSLEKLGDLEDLPQRLQSEVEESKTVASLMGLVGAWCRKPADNWC